MQKTIAAALAASLIGCSAMPHVQVEGWPELKITQHRLSPGEVIAYCGEAMHMGPAVILFAPMACATVNLDSLTCDVYVSALADTFPALLAHELLHCAGKDHGDSFQNYYDEWKRRQ
jgi:hypothetical protein